MISSDLHIHSEFSHDSTLPLAEIVSGAKERGLKTIGVTDHVNFNDDIFLTNATLSAKSVLALADPNVILGVELTPIEKPLFDYLEKTGSRKDYKPTCSTYPYAIELALSKEQMQALGIRYAIGAAHWRVDSPSGVRDESNIDECIKEWYRQQMWLAQDERVTILGHPWYNGKALWYDDFSVIPKSMNSDILCALKDNEKYIECNQHFFVAKTSERFKNQYAEFLRTAFEMGIKVTFGSDCHNKYNPKIDETKAYLSKVGFKTGDLCLIESKDMW